VNRVLLVLCLVAASVAFAAIDTRALVLVIDDTGAGRPDLKYDERKTALAPLVGRSSAADFALWLGEAGYTVEVVPANAVTPASFAGFQAVVYSAGDGTAPLESGVLRDALRGFTEGGGRLVVEGGEVGYDALSFPGYPDFAQHVLHASGWLTDAAGALRLVSGQASHPFAVAPNVLPAAIPLVYGGYGAQDAVEPASGAVVVFGTTVHPGAAGVLVYDDNQAPQAGQIVYFAFDVGAVDPTIGRQLAENALAYLLAAEPPPTASIAGTVTVVGAPDPAGVTVSCGPGHSVTTGADGHYQLVDLYGGSYVVAASKPGYATGLASVSVADGEQLAGVDFTLVPTVAIHVSAAPHLPIPDSSGAGVTSVITVSEHGELADLTVDIDLAHTWIGDLIVRLTSPAGTTVTLHDRSGGSADDLVGNWPETLAVDGPGALADFRDEEIHGAWTLFVSDNEGGDTGTLHTWGLNLLVPQDQTAAPAELPAATRLVGARPNPFNPETTVVFDVARRGPVRLEIFDLRGRLVRRLVAGELPPGRHWAPWDGRDERGRAASSGVYRCRLQAAGTQHEWRLALVR